MKTKKLCLPLFSSLVLGLGYSRWNRPRPVVGRNRLEHTAPQFRRQRV